MIAPSNPPALTREAEPDVLDRLIGAKTIGEVCDLCRTSRYSVRLWIRSGKLPAVKAGHRVLIPADGLRAFLGAGSR